MSGPGCDPKKKREYADRYYGKVPDAPNSGSTWTIRDLQRIVADDRPPEVELARELGRSIEAIQVARNRVVHGLYGLHTDSDRLRVATQGHRSMAPEVLPTATVCARCFCTHPGDC